jgi:hypothetical protein
LESSITHRLLASIAVAWIIALSLEIPTPISAICYLSGVWAIRNIYILKKHVQLYFIAVFCISVGISELLELIQTQMAQKPMLRAEVGMRVRCANKASAE